MDATARNRMTPTNWGATLVGPPVLDMRIGGAIPGLVRRWRGIAPNIDQSSLDEHFLSIHLGGAKRLHRDGEGRRLVTEAGIGSHSFVPAGSSYRWMTEGPIDFVHFYFDPKTIDWFVSSSFDRDPRGAALHDCLGQSDTLIDPLTAAILAEVSNEDGVQQAYLDDLMHLLMFQLLRCYSDAASVAVLSQHALSPHRLRCAIDFIESHLDQPVGVSEIAASVGMSAFHFSRAFRMSTGSPPYAYLLDRRIAAAKRLLAKPGRSIADIARACGFTSPSQFSRMFRLSVGANPTSYRERYQSD